MANQTTIHQGQNGQFKTIVPKGIAEARDVDGQRVELTIESGSNLGVHIRDE